MPEAQLASIRSDESDRAARILSVEPADVMKLKIPEGRLDEAARNAGRILLEYLRSVAPSLIFSPYRLDAHGDHAATSRLALEAAGRLSHSPKVFEYPVWAWHHWPWCPMEYGSRSDIPRVLLADIQATLRMLSRLNVKMPVTVNQTVKRDALEAYQSQMTRLVADDRWLTLKDIAEGEFLHNLLQEYEFFSCVSQ
jgi:LmbE family N-acetylglucosaminyl deacetylase